jgi:hypothetical protein
MRRSRFYLLALTALVAACSDSSSRPAAITGPESGPSMSTTSDGTESGGATVETDLMDYAPGHTVTITGNGFAAGETVHLLLTENFSIHAPRVWDVTADGSGGFTDASFAPEEHHIGVMFTLTATGGTSGRVASTFFSDGTITAASVVSQEGTCTTNQTVFVKGAGAITLCARASVTNIGGTPTAFNVIWYRSGTPGALFAKMQRNGVSSPAAGGSVTNTFSAGTQGLWQARLCLDNPAADCLNPLPGSPIASFTVYSGSLVFLTSAQNFNAGTCSSVITVQKQKPVPTPSTTQEDITLVTSSAGGAFYTDAGCTSAVISKTLTVPDGGTPTTGMNVLIPGGSSTYSFYYKDSNSGSPTITAEKRNTYDYSPTSQTEVVATPEVATTTTLSASPTSPREFGTEVVFTAHVSTNTGTVKFIEGGTCASPTTTLQANTSINGSGDATYTTSTLSVGAHSIVACYSGVVGSYAPSQSSALSYTINKVTTTTALTITPSTQQYSDQVLLSATVTPTSVNSSDITGSVQFRVNGVDVGVPVAITAASNTAQYTYTVSLAAPGPYNVKATFTSTNGNFANSDDTEQLAVTKEDATITYPDANPAALQVSAPGGTLAANALSLIVKVQEKSPDLAAATAAAGDIANAGLTVALSPIGGGSNVNLSCTSAVTGSGYAGIKTFTCKNTAALAVNTYEVIVNVTGNYYTAMTYTDGFTVYDPSLGFATGGGSFLLDGERVTFGFTMKYLKNGTNLQGNLIVVRHRADGTTVRLKSNSLEGLAITQAGTCGVASFSGKATYTRWDAATQAYVTTGNTQFTAYAEDCNNPGTGPDAFWLTSGGSLLSMPGTAAANKATLSGGNIAVPHNAR